MDIKTPKGQQSLVHEQEMLEMISTLRGLTIIQTNKNEVADIDGFMAKDGELEGIFESKCRNMSEEQLNEFGSWIVTYDKIKRGCELAKALRTNFVGFLYLIPCKTSYVWHICDKFGNIKCDMQVRESLTQATVNGGEVLRVNAYLSVSSARSLSYETMKKVHEHSKK